MTILGLHPTVYTDRFAEVRDFYVDLVGLDVVAEDEFALSLAAPADPRVCLCFTKAGAGRETTISWEGHLTIEVVDVDRIHAQACGRGVVVKREPHDRGGRRSCALVDPNGLLVELTAQDPTQILGGWPRLWQLTDLVTPYAIRAAVSLRVFEYIARQPVPVADLARLVNAQASALRRLLRHLANLGLVAEPSPGVFAVTELGRALEPRHQASRMDWLDHDGVSARIDGALLGLLDSVRTGQAAYPTLYGRSFWADLTADPRLRAGFNALMGATTSVLAAGLATAVDWRTVHRVVDVGGGRGITLAEILRAHPDLQGTLVDLPHTVDDAKRTLADAGVMDRCVIVGGSFFDPLPGGADTYLLCNVLHDWDDPEAQLVLRRCAEAAGTTGRVMVMTLVTDGLVDRVAASRLDLLLLALFSGRMRTVGEFSELAAGVGLRLAATRGLARGNVVLEFVAAQEGNYAKGNCA